MIVWWDWTPKLTGPIVQYVLVLDWHEQVNWYVEIAFLDGAWILIALTFNLARYRTKRHINTIPNADLNADPNADP